jgi:hypothetical protein
MTHIFAERSAEKRREGEALIREADNLACQAGMNACGRTAAQLIRARPSIKPSTAAKRISADRHLRECGVATDRAFYSLKSAMEQAEERANAPLTGKKKPGPDDPGLLRQPTPFASSKGSRTSTILAWSHFAHSNVRTSRPELFGVDRKSVIRSLQVGQTGCSMAAIWDFDIARLTFPATMTPQF